MRWLLELTIFQSIAQALKAGSTPTAEEEANYCATYEAAAQGPNSRILSVAGDTAEVAIDGILTKAPSFLAWLFGGGNVTYSEIISAIAEAEQDPSVARIVLAVDSPGGQIDGLFEAIDAIKAAKKPVEARVSNIAASAAYALAAQADSITAVNRAARIGSVGVVATFFVEEDEVTITSTNAPDKRPDITTEEGRAVVRVELDALHKLFAEDIAEGRSTSVALVNATFGKGATVLAQEAVDKGMIDAIAAPVFAVVGGRPTTAESGTSLEVTQMDLATLKAEHPELYALVMKLGADEEHDNVCAHLKLGAASGAMDIAVTAITERKPMTASVSADYMAAGMNKAAATARTEDDGAAAAALDGAPAAGDDDARDNTANAALLKASANALGVTVEEVPLG